MDESDAPTRNNTEVGPEYTLASLMREAVEVVTGTAIDHLRLRALDIELDIHQNLAADPSTPIPAQPALKMPEAADAAIKAPCAGVFYRAPAPGDEVFVKSGDEVAAGTKVGLIEAMKTFTPVTTDRPGRIIHIHVEDNQIVEYGEHLMMLAPSSRAARSIGEQGQ
ncbi:biotin/lipoyl-containing protein [Streptomyces sp. TRM 70351]|uniref:acetyl-CoA carboxylase biotin carboxyl carrier protein n=1 Tax=Streptomyces sp. TRM 70351 TaxID=3116552 RepID=UPI002E7AD4A3|nr:biotin/lipoyl-containing protein [Streptomyces sp. TRM 70351]MEE1930822.1 biotin/lipoyl-containing protein [Streptomyces sp. TRM 70351]